MHVLLVEDNPRNLHNGLMALEKAGHTVSIALNVEQFENQLLTNSLDGIPFDAVLTDLGLPESGFNTPINSAEKITRSNWTVWDVNKREHFVRDQFKSLDDRIIELLVRESISLNALVNTKRHQSFFYGTVSLETVGAVIAKLVAANIVPKHLGLLVIHDREEQVFPLGYRVLETCREAKLPVAFLSSINHQSHMMLAPIIAGYETAEMLSVVEAQKYSEPRIQTRHGIFSSSSEKTEEDWLNALALLET